jgi:antitoxin HicB
MSKNPRIGESFESFLRDEGIHEDVAATAVKRTLALQTAHKVAAKNMSKSDSARRIKTSTTQLGRLVDHDND